MKKILLLITFLLLAGLASATDFRQIYESKMGNVEFNHASHSQTIECEVCHHTAKEIVLVEVRSNVYLKCSACHTDSSKIKSKKAFHNTCKTCHTKNAGPTKCKGCHVK